MPRRLFVLLVLVVFAGLWTPPQGTKAQSGCPVGGCKVYLPFVPTPTYITIREVMTGYESRGCYRSRALFYITNITNIPITNINISGSVTSYTYVFHDDDDGYDVYSQGNGYSLAADDVLFPGETFVYPVGIGGCAADGPYEWATIVHSVTPIDTVRKLTVETTDIILHEECYGNVKVYDIEGFVRNTGSSVLQNAKVYATLLYGRGYMNLEKSVIEPNESVHFTGSVNYAIDSADYCDPGPYHIDPSYVTIHGWGDIVP